MQRQQSEFSQKTFDYKFSDPELDIVKMKNNSKHFVLKSQPVKFDYQAKCIVTPGTVTQESGKKFTATWVFLNNGESAWPENVELRQINGCELEYSAIKINDSTAIEPQTQMSFVTEIAAPKDTKSIEHAIQFRLHSFENGESVGFGEVVTLNIVIILRTFE